MVEDHSILGLLDYNRNLPVQAIPCPRLDKDAKAFSDCEHELALF
jgi:hypothetical protein